MRKNGNRLRQVRCHSVSVKHYYVTLRWSDANGPSTNRNPPPGQEPQESPNPQKSVQVHCIICYLIFHSKVFVLRSCRKITYEDLHSFEDTTEKRLSKILLSFMALAASSASSSSSSISAFNLQHFAASSEPKGIIQKLNIFVKTFE